MSRRRPIFATAPRTAGSTNGTTPGLLRYSAGLALALHPGPTNMSLFSPQSQPPISFRHPPRLHRILGSSPSRVGFPRLPIRSTRGKVMAPAHHQPARYKHPVHHPSYDMLLPSRSRPLQVPGPANLANRHPAFLQDVTGQPTTMTTTTMMATPVILLQSADPHDPSGIPGHGSVSGANASASVNTSRKARNRGSRVFGTVLPSYAHLHPVQVIPLAAGSARDDLPSVIPAQPPTTKLTRSASMHTLTTSTGAGAGATGTMKAVRSTPRTQKRLSSSALSAFVPSRARRIGDARAPLTFKRSQTLPPSSKSSSTTRQADKMAVHGQELQAPSNKRSSRSAGSQRHGRPSNLSSSSSSSLSSSVASSSSTTTTRGLRRRSTTSAGVLSTASSRGSDKPLGSRSQRSSPASNHPTRFRPMSPPPLPPMPDLVRSISVPDLRARRAKDVHPSMQSSTSSSSSSSWSRLARSAQSHLEADKTLTKPKTAVPRLPPQASARGTGQIGRRDRHAGQGTTTKSASGEKEEEEEAPAFRSEHRVGDPVMIYPKPKAKRGPDDAASIHEGYVHEVSHRPWMFGGGPKYKASDVKSGGTDWYPSTRLAPKSSASPRQGTSSRRSSSKTGGITRRPPPAAGLPATVEEFDQRDLPPMTLVV